MTRLGLVIFSLLPVACAFQTSPPGGDVRFLRDPASGMCTPVQADDGGRESMPWSDWDACDDPCAGLDAQACAADPRCAPGMEAPCPPGALCLTAFTCEATPRTDACLGLDEATCTATPGCFPAYAVEPCDCPAGPEGAACSCPAAGEHGYRGCLPAPIACSSSEMCGEGQHCSVDDGVCLPPAERCGADGVACATVCTGFCVAGGVPPRTCASSQDCGPGTHCTVEDGSCAPPPDCDADPAGICPTFCSGVCVPEDPPPGCFGVTDEQTCVARPECEAVYAGSRCFCDAQGCGCLEYTFDGCRDRRIAPTCERRGVIGAWRNGDGPEGIIDRTYRFDADGSFVVTDEIAPCPPDATCVWSGLIENRGSWRRDDRGAVTLVYREPLQRWEGLRFSSVLEHAGCPSPRLIEAETGRVFTPAAP